MAGLKRPASRSIDDYDPGTQLSRRSPASKRQRTETSPAKPGNVTGFLRNGYKYLSNFFSRSSEMVKRPNGQRATGQTQASIDLTPTRPPALPFQTTSSTLSAYPNFSGSNQGILDQIAHEDERAARSGDCADPIDLTADDDPVSRAGGRTAHPTLFTPDINRPGPSHRHRITSSNKVYPPLPDLFPSSFSAASPSESPLNPTSPFSTTFSRPPPRRPDVTNYELPRRTYGWETPDSSSQGQPSRPIWRTPRKKSRLAKSQATTIARHAMLQRIEKVFEPAEKDKMRRLKRILAIQPRENERKFKELAAKGKDSRQALEAMLTDRSKSLEDSIKPVPKPFEPERKRSAGDRARARARLQPTPSNVEDILESLRLEDREKEEAIKAALLAKAKPKLPKKLTDEQDAVANAALKNRAFSSRVASEIVGHASLNRLCGAEWLNDEVVNFYGALLQKRADEELGEDGEPRVQLHVFNSFFYGKISQGGHATVRRWTKKVDLFAKDLVIFPINVKGVHWTAGVIDMTRKRIEYYDSMGDFGGMKREFFQHVRAYLEAEHVTKRGKPFDFTGWQDAFNPDAPQQDNGSDCGVFSCQTLEARTRGLDLIDGQFEFGAANMPFLRRLMIWEIASVALARRW